MPVLFSKHSPRAIKLLLVMVKAVRRRIVNPFSRRYANLAELIWKIKENINQDLWQHGPHSHPEPHQIRIRSARISNMMLSPIVGGKLTTVIPKKRNAACCCKKNGYSFIIYLTRLYNLNTDIVSNDLIISE
jgi:hypothetical protein